MDAKDMEERTLDFGVRVYHLCSSIPRRWENTVITRQLLRSATSVGANYREAVHASSRKQFISILEIAQRECAETEYWIDLTIKCNLMNINRLSSLRQECRELRSILTSTIITAKTRRNESNNNEPN